MKKMAPIVIFAFNRQESLQKLISSLVDNDESLYSDLFVFVDGFRAHKPGEIELVEQVRNYVKKIAGFKSVNSFFSNENKGLGPSIISGVTEVINRYGRAIVLEDDLIVSKNFLSYMNQGLDKYEKNEKVFSICGYSNRVRTPLNYSADTYFCSRSSSWGWATWADRWNSVDWVLEPFNTFRKFRSAFNRWGGSDCWKMLNDWHAGKNKSWAIRFCFAQFLQDKLSLFPIVSKVSNNGFDGMGTNCKRYSRFKCEFDSFEKKKFVWLSDIYENKSLKKQALSYHSLMIRVWSRIMYLVYR